MNRLTPALLLIALLAHGAAQAEASQVSPSGFVSQYREEVSVPPEAMWKAMVQLPRWWSGRHSYSGDARHFSFDAQAGGCFCERWGDGHSVQHATVLMVQNGRVLRLSGAFGPLQELGVNGVLTIVTAAQDGKTFLRMTYRVVGHADSGLDKLAAPVDQVLGVQFQRLKNLAEKGSAE